MGFRAMIVLACFIAPFALYALYDWMARRQEEAGRDSWPITVLWLTGAVIAVEAIVIAVLNEEGLSGMPIERTIPGQPGFTP